METAGTKGVRLGKCVTVGCFALCLLSILAYLVSYQWCISYARGNFFLVITDGYFAVPFPDGKPRTWDDWGWWVQQPWSTGDDASGGIRNRYQSPGFLDVTRQLGSLGIHIPFLIIIVPTLIFLTMRGLPDISSTQSARILVGAYLMFTAGFLIALLSAFENGSANLACIVGFVTVTSTSVGFMRGSKRNRREQVGHCGVCDYDLFGNTSGRCPECGSLIPQKSRLAELSHPPDDLDAAGRSG